MTVTVNTSQRSRVGVGMNRSVREGMPIYDYCTLEFIMTNFITIVYKHRQDKLLYTINNHMVRDESIIDFT